jgi:mannitol/fructose-specific phosphotransferase system IIA component (Ntr-type)
MDLTRLLPAAHCIVNLTAKTRQEALKELMVTFIDTGIITDADEFFKDLEQREEQITTVVGNGVAIPHARTQSAGRLGLAVGFWENEGSISYSDDPSTEKVNILFMICIPSFAPASHLPLLQHIAKFIRNEKKVAKLLNSKTPAAAAKYLHSFKSK